MSERFGPKWEREMMRLTKKQIVQMVKSAGAVITAVENKDYDQCAAAMDYIRLLRAEASEELDHCGRDSESYRWRVGRVRDAIMAYRSIGLFEKVNGT